MSKKENTEDLEKVLSEEEAVAEDENTCIDEAEEIYGRMYSQKKWVEIINDYRYGDVYHKQKAAEMAQKAMDPFIISVANRYYPTYMPKYGDDILQEGRLGLLESMLSYDPFVSRPTTWCFRSIIHNMRDFIDNQIHHTTPHFYDNIRKIEGAVRDLEKAGKSTDIEQVQILTKLSRTTLNGCYSIAKRNAESTSLSEPVGDGNSVVEDFLSSEVMGPEETAIHNADYLALLKDMKQILTKKEYDVMVLYYGLYEEEECSATTIEEYLHIKKQQVREIRSRAEEKLRRSWSKNERYNDERLERAERMDSMDGLSIDKLLLTREFESFDFENETNDKEDLFDMIIQEYREKLE